MNNSEIKSEKATLKILFQLFILLALIFFVVFLKLGAFHMRVWDESMFAVNTYEMMHNGNFFSNYFDGHPDICNTKPPLTIWIQIIFVKLFGYNELALRLPSAIAAALVILIVFIFVYKRFNSVWAWASALILLTSSGFITYHTARTAEADSLLTLFLVLANLFFVKFILEEKKQNILYFFLFLTLAFATKMFAALLFIPAYFIVLLIFKKFKSFVVNKYFVFGTLLFFVVNIGFVLLRNYDNPGYLHEFFSKDAGRMLLVIENHKEIFSYYIDNLIQTHFAYWFVLFIIGLVFIFISKNEKEKNLLLIFSIFILSYFLIISISATKLPWYDMPLYPFMAVITAYPIFVVINWFLNSKPVKSTLKVTLILITIFVYPYYMMFRQSQENLLNYFEKENEASERFLFKNNNKHVDLSNTKVYYTGFNGSLLFYKYKMHEINQNIELVTSADFAVNDKVLVSNDSLKSILKKKYSYKVLDAYDNAELVRIESEIHSSSRQ